MHVIVHTKADGIDITHPSKTLVAVMMGEGFGWDQKRVDHEIDKWVNPAFGAAKLDVAVATPYVEALAKGGLSETEAILLIQDKDEVIGCLGHRLVDPSELPEDRTTRHLWEYTGTVIRVKPTR